MRSDRVREMVVAISLVWGLVALSSAMGAEPVYTEQDRDGDGKIDIRNWCDDRATTTVSAQSTTVSRKLDGGQASQDIWTDTDGDGKYDVRSHEYDFNDGTDGILEIWRKKNPGDSECFYSKRDTRAMLSTRGKTPELGSRILTDVTTEAIPAVERLAEGGWIDHNAGFSVWRAGGALRRVRLRNAREEVDLHFYPAIYNDFPQEASIKEWDMQGPGPRRLKTSLSLMKTRGPLKGNVDKYDSVEWTQFTGTGEDILVARDRNRDGIFESFVLKRPDGSKWTEEDNDSDGLLDAVEIRAADGSTTRRVGAEISDRKVPTVTIPYEKIRAALERARAGLPKADAPILPAHSVHHRSGFFIFQKTDSHPPPLRSSY